MSQRLHECPGHVSKIAEMTWSAYLIDFLLLNFCYLKDFELIKIKKQVKGIKNIKHK